MKKPTSINQLFLGTINRIKEAKVIFKVNLKEIYGIKILRLVKMILHMMICGGRKDQYMDKRRVLILNHGEILAILVRWVEFCRMRDICIKDLKLVLEWEIKMVVDK